MKTRTCLGTAAGHDRSSALMAVMGVLAVMAVMAAVLVPNLVRKQMRLNAAREANRIELVAQGVIDSIERTQRVPGASNWVDAVMLETGLNRTEVAQVYPQYPSETNNSRVFLIHPSFTPGTGADLLPYEQPATGVDVSATNEPAADTRLMVMSSTRRELALPLGSGVPTAAEFDAIWDWAHDPATKSPPAGWPAAWSGQGDALQVEKLNLANRFHVVTLKDLFYSVNDSSPWETVTDEVQRHLLRGSLLKIYDDDSVLYASHLVKGDVRFELTSQTEALLYYKLNETTGLIAVNSGTAGSAADGMFTNSPTLGMAGPRPPGFPGLPSNNNAVWFNGEKDFEQFMTTDYQLPASISNFTMAGWMFATAEMEKDGGLFGQIDVFSVMAHDKDEIKFKTKESGELKIQFKHPTNAWYHLTVLGDSLQLRFYTNGVLAGVRNDEVVDYAHDSDYPFRIGGNLKDDNDYGYMIIDEVLYYERVLTDTEILGLYSGTVP